MTFLSALGVRIWTCLAAAGALLLIGLKIVTGIKRAERDRVKAQAAETARKQRDTRDEIDRSVAREPDPAEQLRRDWSR